MESNLSRLLPKMLERSSARCVSLAAVSEFAAVPRIPDILPSPESVTWVPCINQAMKSSGVVDQRDPPGHGRAAVGALGTCARPCCPGPGATEGECDDVGNLTDACLAVAVLRECLLAGNRTETAAIPGSMGFGDEM